MQDFFEEFQDEDLFLEAAYESSPTLKKVEGLFGKIHSDVLAFYDGMKKHDLNPDRVQDVYNYYYSTLPDTDGTRFTQYNDNLKQIEDLIKKMFHFRSVRIDFRMICYYGPHTSVVDKVIMTVPVIIGEQKVIRDYIDIGKLQTLPNGKARYRVGYRSELKASQKGLVDTSDAIVVRVNMEMDKRLEPKHYVGILLHEIGHNLDIERLNIDVKNDSKFIKVLSTYGKRSSLNPIPSMKILFTLLKERNNAKKSHYTDALIKQMEKIGSSIGYGGEDKRSELFADALPTAYGYGPAMIEAINILSPDIRKNDKLKQTKGLFSAYKNYTKALQVAARLGRREGNVHGSNMYRLKSIMAQLQKDLAECKDSKIKARLKENIKELNKIIEAMVNEKGNTAEMKALLQAWVDHIDVMGPKEEDTKPTETDEKKEKNLTVLTKE